LKNKSLALALPAKALFNNVALLPQRQIQNKPSTQVIINDPVIGCGFPLSMVQNDHFRHFMSVTDAKYRPPCRQTLIYSLIPKKVDEKRDSLKKHLTVVTVD